jgi:hypothetical protein
MYLRSTAGGYHNLTRNFPFSLLCLRSGYSRPEHRQLSPSSFLSHRALRALHGLASASVLQFPQHSSFSTHPRILNLRLPIPIHSAFASRLPSPPPPPFSQSERSKNYCTAIRARPRGCMMSISNDNNRHGLLITILININAHPRDFSRKRKQMTEDSYLPIVSFFFALLSPSHRRHIAIFVDEMGEWTWGIWRKLSVAKVHFALR